MCSALCRHFVNLHCMHLLLPSWHGLLLYLCLLVISIFLLFQVGRRINVLITRINEETNDLILSEKEAWVSSSHHDNLVSCASCFHCFCYLFSLSLFSFGWDGFLSRCLFLYQDFPPRIIYCLRTSLDYFLFLLYFFSFWMLDSTANVKSARGDSCGRNSEKTFSLWRTDKAWWNKPKVIYTTLSSGESRA